MTTITARNVNEAFGLAMMHLRTSGVARHSRAGAVVEMQEPVLTTYMHPYERVIFDQKRDANPFFHFFESLWMLYGGQDVKFVSWFNSAIKQFSDDGETFHGAYGYRWRHHFTEDQIEQCVTMLKEDKSFMTRRVVLCMWDPEMDLGVDSKDIPCNDLIFFKVDVVTGELRMTVCCRSNDAIWGAYGANAVHFSMLHEYVAGRVGLQQGFMYQLSDSLHAYTDKPQWEKLKNTYVGGRDLYADGIVTNYPIMQNPNYWDQDLATFMQWIYDEWPREDFDGSPGYCYSNKFFNEVAEPMAIVFKLYKDLAPGGGLAMVDQIQASDWRFACREWLERREL